MKLFTCTCIVPYLIDKVYIFVIRFHVYERNGYSLGLLDILAAAISDLVSFLIVFYTMVNSDVVAFHVNVIPRSNSKSKSPKRELT